ncbi:MAG: hypothetical protein BGO29_00770 [Bacteroidales bacterium 36-12]|jgi:hypothetical protein|nr:MAG: hypothetical protein BGO29_00770 [Bacteroidales bacterium 36-12]
MKRFNVTNTAIFSSILALSLLITTGCDDFLTPDKDNIYTEDEIIRDPSMAEGVLLNAYSNIPNSTGFSEVATDDAVSNDNSNNYRLATNGEWKSTNNPFNVWGGSYTNIAYTNLFLNIVDRVNWSPMSEWKNEHFRKRLRAEAYALRAFYEFRLLQVHSGYDESGNLLGFPITNTAVTINDDWKAMGRDSYEDCVNQIVNDLDEAISELPDTWSDAPGADPDKGTKDAVYGSRFSNRISKRAAQMLKARTLLHAASPAFNPTNDVVKWEKAADAAAEIIDAFGGLANVKNTRLEFYLNENNADILWRKDYSNARSLETDNFPPSLFGNGRVNPTQNFVDEFPTVDGMPLSTNPITYDPAAPYANRDPRLAKYVITNGASLKNTVINTVNGAKDGINMLAGASTRTGYYLKKHMNANVNLTPGNLISQRRFATLMRYTEAFMIYAEAANEAWGPDGKGTHAYSAREVIAKFRETAGIATDNYIGTVNTKEDMRKLVRSERRIELSFEGFRFWDIRRWADTTLMKERARGTQDGGLTSFEVESRVFDNYMIYGPIPDSEYRKGLVQNAGW